MTVAELLEEMTAAHIADIESEPFPTFEHLTPEPPKTCACGATGVALVYQWRPAGKSVFELKCRDCKDQVPS